MTLGDNTSVTEPGLRHLAVPGAPRRARGMVAAWMLAGVWAAVVLRNRVPFLVAILAVITAVFAWLFHRARNMSIDLTPDHLVIDRVLTRETVNRNEVADVQTDGPHQTAGQAYFALLGGSRPWEAIYLRLNIGLQVQVVRKPVDRSASGDVPTLSASILDLARELKEWLTPEPLSSSG